MATTAELVTRCETRFGDPDNAIYSEANWLSYLNDAYAWLLGSLPWAPWRESRTTTLVVDANTSTEPLPTDVWRVNFVDNTTDGYKLRPFRSRIQMRQVMAQGEAGAPLYYRLFDSGIQVFPTPTVNTTLTVEYFGPEADLAVGSVNPTIPAEFHGALVEYALFLGYADDDDSQNAAVHQAAAEERRKQLEDYLGASREEANPVLVDDWFADAWYD